MRHDDSGASAVEYGVLVAAVAGVLVAVLFLLGENVTTLFGDSCRAVRDRAAPAETC